MDGTKSKIHMLSHVQSCLVRAVLDEGVKKLQLLQMIANESKTKGHQKRSKTDMHTLLLRRSELEKKYSRLMKRRSALRGLHNKKEYEENQKQLQELSKMLSSSIVAIGTNLQESNNPSLYKNLQKIEKDRYMLESLTRITLKELASDYTFNTLVEQTNTQLGELHNLAHTKKKRAVVRNQLKSLEHILKKEWEIFEKDVRSRDQEITKLTLKLQHLRVENELTLKYEMDTAVASANTSERLIRKKKQKIDREIEDYKMKLERNKVVGETAMKFLMSRQNEMDTEDSKWAVKYKEDKKEWVNKLDDLKEIRLLDRARLDALRAKKAKMEQEAKEVKELEKKKSQTLKMRRGEEKRMFVAASKIRFYWNVYWRKEGAKAAKGGKKGKKKKK